MIDVRVEDLAFYAGDAIIRPATATLGATTPLLRKQMAEVAVPPLGLGAGNLDIDESAALMADELTRHFASASFPRRVTLVAETADEAHSLESAITRALV